MSRANKKIIKNKQMKTFKLIAMWLIECLKGPSKRKLAKKQKSGWSQVREKEKNWKSQSGNNILRFPKFD